MAGHNKWSKIKRKKLVTDGRRSKAWTMCLRAVMMAARSGGPDPDFNFALRTAIDEAKYHNVPKDNLERAIKKGAGGGDGENYEQARYEGHGPGGVAIVVESLTNNRTRTAGDLRLIFSDHNGKLGTTGCVGFMFETKRGLQDGDVGLFALRERIGPAGEKARDRGGEAGVSGRVSNELATGVERRDDLHAASASTQRSITVRRRETSTMSMARRDTTWASPKTGRLSA